MGFYGGNTTQWQQCHMQVEHAFKSWTTGAYVKITSLKGYFSANNFGDKIIKVMGKYGCVKHINNCHATQYVSTINASKNHH